MLLLFYCIRIHVSTALHCTATLVCIKGLLQHNNHYTSIHLLGTCHASPSGINTEEPPRFGPCCAPATRSIEARPGCALPSRRKHALTTANIITTTFNTIPQTFATTLFTTASPSLLSPTPRNHCQPNRGVNGAALAEIGLRDQRSAWA